MTCEYTSLQKKGDGNRFLHLACHDQLKMCMSFKDETVFLIPKKKIQRAKNRKFLVRFKVKSSIYDLKNQQAYVKK